VAIQAYKASKAALLTGSCPLTVVGIPAARPHQERSDDIAYIYGYFRKMDCATKAGFLSLDPSGHRRLPHLATGEIRRLRLGEQVRPIG
jgi:hypothetical protein